MQPANRPIAYSYMRYSSEPQGDGDSIRRQTSLARAWCDRNGARLDTTTTYADHGKSAFRGKHRETGVLASFLSDVEAERIPRGSFLIVENLDRLSRESPWDAVPLLCSIVNAGVSVVTLSPSEVVYKRGRDLTPLILAVVEFGRANSESETKSGRTNENWTAKKQKARSEGEIVTRRLPAWVQEKDGKLIAIYERVRLVRQIFGWAIKGYGLSMIVQKLTDAKIPTWGRSRTWSKQYIHKILTGRMVLGEYQPMKAGEREDASGKRKTGFVPTVPDGEPIANYYPAVIDLEMWTKASAAIKARSDRKLGGRLGKKVTNLFTGLITDARTRGRMLIAWQTRGSKKGRNFQKARVLVSASSMEGIRPSISFPYPVFEQEVLKLLKEVKSADVIGKEPPSKSANIAADLADTERRIRQIEAELIGDGDDVPALVRALTALDSKRQAQLQSLQLARQVEANPRSEAWAEAKTLLDLAQDESHRLRLRGLLQIVVEGMWVLVVPFTSHRIAALQINFRGGNRRHYLIAYKPAGNNRVGAYGAKSTDRGKLEGIDLSKKEDAMEAEKWLNNLSADDANDLLMSLLAPDQSPQKSQTLKRRPKR